MLEGLIGASEAAGYWTLQGQTFAGNHASRKLHESCNFRQVGTRERYGHLDDVWHDIILYERRSSAAGGPGLRTRSCDDD